VATNAQATTVATTTQGTTVATTAQATTVATNAQATTVATTAQGTTVGAITSAAVSRLDCTELGWKFCWGNTDVCAQSYVEGPGVCHVNSHTWAQANQVCDYVGGRLCTSDELLANAARGTGCAIDWEATWTSTTCAGGGMQSRLGAADTNPATCQTDLSVQLSVRCCADGVPTTPSSTLPETTALGASTTAPISVVSSSATCAQLGWSFKGEGAAMGVCAASVIGGSCRLNTDTYNDAAQLCAAEGARLCTADELKANVGQGTGCSVDYNPTWSQTPCVGGVLTRKGADDGAQAVCETNLDSRRSVRCCADVTAATTVPTTVQATTVATTVQATTVATTVQATTVPTTVQATTVSTTVQATTVATSVQATTVVTTVQATTVATTAQATTSVPVSTTTESVQDVTPSSRTCTELGWLYRYAMVHTHL
jgi:hypothetical protein